MTTTSPSSVPEGAQRAPASTGRFRPILAIVLIAAVGFLLRMGAAILAPPHPSAELADTLWYHETAVLLAAGRGYVNPMTGYSTASWPPGYPLILAAAYRLLGADPRTGVLVNALAGTFTCLCCYGLTRLTRGSHRSGLIAEALIALLPSHILFAPLLLSESVFTAVACGTLLAAGMLLPESDRRRRLWWWVPWGVAVGVAALVRVEGVLLLPIAVAAALTLYGFRRAVRVLAVASLGLACVLGPWAYRNAGVFHAFVPLSNGFGRSFWVGHNEAATGAITQSLQDLAIATLEPQFHGGLTPEGELQRNRYYTARVLEYARRNPGREAVLFLRKLYYLFRGDHVWLYHYEYRARPGGLTEATRRILGRVGNAYYLLVLLPGLAGWLIFVRAPSAPERVLALFPVFWCLMFAIMHGDPRFHFPLMPVFCVMATRAVWPTRSEPVREQP